MGRTVPGLAAVSVAVALAVVAGSLAPGGSGVDGSVEVTRAADDAVVVTVLQDDTPRRNVSVSVQSTDERTPYAGRGTYVTGSDGTVALPPPERDVTIVVSADGPDWSASTTATVPARDGQFGERFGTLVSTFVRDLQDDDRDGLTRFAAANDSAAHG
jgi:hypothetical protein